LLLLAVFCETVETVHVRGCYNSQIPRRGTEDDEGSISGECPVCLDSLSGGDAVLTLPCNHALHQECVDQLRKHCFQQACPLCRAALPAGPEVLSIIEQLSSNQLGNHHSAGNCSPERECSSPAYTKPPTSTICGARKLTSTPAVRMPDAPRYVQQMDDDYLITVLQLESKEWAMWELLTSHGLKVQSPENDPTLYSRAPQPLPRFQCYSDSVKTEIFDLDL